jgi:hypothetical protein
MAVMLSLVGSGVALTGMGSQRFPHERHADLFPTCLGCHAGVPDGDSATVYSVSPSFCAGCHDGSVQPEVDWSGPTAVASNLVFTHTEHPPLDCAVCHRTPGGEPMQIQRAESSICLTCHAPNAEEHQATGVPCAKCHTPVAEARTLSIERVAGFPQPTDHGAEDFIAVHGGLSEVDFARCSMCHAQESCSRCHLNADRVATIRDLPTDERVAQLAAGRSGVWPEPASHETADWLSQHGGLAMESIQSCANCHAEESCASCHGEATPQIARGLSRRPPAGPQGVLVAAARPPGHTPSFVTEHATAAGVGLPNCTSCHLQSFCSDCHTGPATPRFSRADASGFHPANFVTRHSAEAYASQTECTACHSTEAFCRDCHLQVGIGQRGNTTGGAYHDAQSIWLLAHGRAARQGLEECAACHDQTSCLRCHSAKFGLRINPHGSAFEPDRLQERSTMSCAICHFPGQLDPP